MENCAKVSIENKNGETFVNISQESGSVYATVNKIVVPMHEYKALLFILKSIDDRLKRKNSEKTED